MDRVQCGECAHLYDSEEHPFCPRCGSIGKSETVAATATSIVQRNHPKRRRAQVSGIVLAVVGGITASLFVLLLFLAPTLVPEALTTIEDQPGGPLDLTVHADNVTVQLLRLNGTYIADFPLENGTGSMLLPQAAIQMQIMHANESWTWTLFHLNQSATPLEFETSLEESPGDQGLYEGNTYIRGTQLFVGVLATVSLFTLYGGIQAFRLRRRGVALSGAIVGALPWLIMFFIAPNFATGLMMVVFFLAAGFIQGAKEHFR